MKRRLKNADVTTVIPTWGYYVDRYADVFRQLGYTVVPDFHSVIEETGRLFISQLSEIIFHSFDVFAVVYAQRLAVAIVVIDG